MKTTLIAVVMNNAVMVTKVSKKVCIVFEAAVVPTLESDIAGRRGRPELKHGNKVIHIFISIRNHLLN